jgi:hypothetical protein
MSTANRRHDAGAHRGLKPVGLIERHADRRADRKRREHRNACPGHRHPGPLWTDRSDRPGDAAGDKLSFTEPCGQSPDDHDGQTGRRRQARFGGDEVEQTGERADNGALQSRSLATLAVGHPTRISTSEHRSQELDPDDQSDDQRAEPKLVMNEQRKDRERQADGEIATEQSCDDTWCRT